MHADFIEYNPIKKEIVEAEDIKAKPVREDELVVLFTAFEKGDDEALVRKAVLETKEFLEKLGANKIMIYPFAHLSQDLARPSEAMPLSLLMEKEALARGIETSRAPFGWTKALEIKVKGHPLAEMSRNYSHRMETRDSYRKQNPIIASHAMLARVRKSDFGHLAETDHRTLGERMDLFSFQEPSPGMVYWHDKGLRLKNLLVSLLKGELVKRGYTEVSSPALANTTLWMVSGHWDYYKTNMFLTRLGDEEMGLKPMNCPSTFLIYKTRRWSFRDLPVRYADFDPLYRNELSGVATGLFRVKILTQDDAHVIATDEQAEAELSDMLDLMEKIYSIFNLRYTVNVSTRPDESMGTDEEWKRATDTLVRVLKSRGIAYEIKEKEGNFYAPKIDVDIKDSLGREWQCGTFQLDLQMPKQFNLSYTGSDGREHTPVVIHRTICGSLERFIGILLEHYGGKLPLWLSPVQARVLAITDAQVPYAESVLAQLLAQGVRAEGSFEHATLGAKIRDAQIQKIPYVVVVGQKEEASCKISLRTREGLQKQDFRVEDLVLEVKLRSEEFE